MNIVCNMYICLEKEININELILNFLKLKIDNLCFKNLKKISRSFIERIIVMKKKRRKKHHELCRNYAIIFISKNNYCFT